MRELFLKGAKWVHRFMSSSKRFSGHGRERLLVFYYNQVLGSKVGSYPRNRRLLTRRKVSRISTYFSMYMNCFVGSGNRVDCYFVLFIWHHKHLRFAKLNADSCHCFTSTFEMLSTAGFHVHLFARCRSYYKHTFWKMDSLHGRCILCKCKTKGLFLMHNECID